MSRPGIYLLERREILKSLMTAFFCMPSLLCLSALAVGESVPPIETTVWLRPAQCDNAMPYWGHRNGIGITVPALRGPRGLIGIQTPYLGQKEYHVLNFIAIEPVVQGRRGFSEMEQSPVDGVQGLRLWTTDEPDRDAEPGKETRPAQGRLETVDGVQTLRLYVHIERMRNGAQPVIEVVFRADRPHEVGFIVHAAAHSSVMDSCILSATMGNYARLRQLLLKPEQADATALWKGQVLPDNGFFPHCVWPLDKLIAQEGDVVVLAQPNEPDPTAAQYDPGVPSHWRYQGVAAIQYWRHPLPSPGLICRVNGRATYYGSSGAEIPGGPAFENFELEEPFAEGQQFQFGATPLSSGRNAAGTGPHID